MQPIRLRPLTLTAAMAAALVVGISLGAAAAPDPAKRFVPLLVTTKTVMDEPIVYPGGTARFTTGIVTLEPGGETGWHTHGVPLTGLILEGDMTVDYGEKGTRTYHAGESIAEAIKVPHNGKNSGTVPVKLFVVYAGAEGVATTTPVKP